MTTLSMSSSASPGIVTKMFEGGGLGGSVVGGDGGGGRGGGRRGGGGEGGGGEGGGGRGGGSRGGGSRGGGGARSTTPMTTLVNSDVCPFTVAQRWNLPTCDVVIVTRRNASSDPPIGPLCEPESHVKLLLTK